MAGPAADHGGATGCGAARSALAVGTVDAMSRTLKLVGPLVVWTLLVWSSRIRNIWTDDDLTAGGQVLRTLIAVVFLAFAGALARALWVGRGQGLSGGDRVLLGTFVIWSVGFWLVRGIGIIVDDHTTGFTLIHTALMIASIGIALLAGSALSSTAAASISSSSAAAR